MSQIRSQVGSSSFVSVAGNGTRVVLSLVTTILVSRWLGANDFGDASFIISSLAFLYYLLAVGFDHSMPFFISRLLADGNDRDAKRTLKIGLISSAVFSAAVSAIFIISLPAVLDKINKPHLYIPMIVFLAQMPIGALANIVAGYLRGEKRFFPSILKDQILLPGLTLVAAFVLVKLLDFGVTGFGFAQLAGFTAGFIYIVYYFVSSPRRKSLSADEVEVSTPSESVQVSPGSMIKFSLPVGLANAVEPLVLHACIMIGGIFFAAADVGRFSASFRVAFFAQFFMQSIAPIFSPFISELFKKRQIDEVRALHHNVHFWCAKWSLFFGFAVFVAGDLMLAPFGSEFSGSEGILLGLTLGCMAEGILGSTRQSLLMIGRNFLNLFDFIMAALLNVTLGYFWSQKFGLPGLVAAFSTTFLLLNLLRATQFWWITRIFPLSTLQALYIVTAGAVLTGIGFGLHQLGLTGVSRIASLLVLLSGTFIFLFWQDRDLIRKVLRRA